MRNKFAERIMAFVVSLALASSGCFAVYTKSETVSPGLTYTKSITYDGKNRETEFVFEYDPNESTSLEFLYGNGVYGFSTLGKMIESARQNGDNVVGGINCDFFAPQTGVPMSAMIIDGELVSSDDSKPALGFDADGNAFIGYPSISIKMSGECFSYSIGHVNKAPTEYSPYLLTDKFGDTTRTSHLSTEIVLMPVTEEYNEEIYAEYISEITLENELGKNIENKPIVQENDASDLSEEAQDKFQPEADECSENIAEIQSTIEIPSSENNNDLKLHSATAQFDFSKFFSEEKLTANSQISAVVTEIRYSCTNGTIPDGAFVITVDDRPYKNIFSAVKVGDKYVIETACAQGWENAVSAVGGGSVLIKGGEAVEQPNDYIYAVKNPRSAVGIRQDGSLVFFAVDGRRSGYSNGMTADVLTERLSELECVDAMNFDGGGSVTVYAALPGSEAKLVNKPSDGGERAISNAAVFVNQTNGDGEIAGFHMELEDFYILGGGNVYDLPENVYAHDNAYLPLGSVADDEYSLFTDGVFGTINEDGNFVSGDAEGICDIICTIGEKTEKAASVYVTNLPDSFKLSASDEMLTENNPVTLTASAHKDLLPVYFDFEKLWCSVNGSALAPLPYEDDEITVNENGIVMLKPVGDAEAIEISIAAGDKLDTVKLKIYRPVFHDMDEHWAKDVAEKAKSLGIMEGVFGEDGKRLFKPDSQIVVAQLCTMMVRYMGIEHERYADFDFESKDATVKYDASTEWALPYAAAIFDTGLLNPFLIYDDFGHMTVDITRRVTRADAMRMLGYICPTVENSDEVTKSDSESENGHIDVKDEASITDAVEYESVEDELSEQAENSESVFHMYSDISELEADPFAYNISKSLVSGVFSGYPDGTMRPDAVLTRAQTAAVFVRIAQSH